MYFSISKKNYLMPIYAKETKHYYLHIDSPDFKRHFNYHLDK